MKSPGITLFASPSPAEDYSIWIIVVSVVCAVLLIIVIIFLIYWICLCHRKAHQSKVIEMVRQQLTFLEACRQSDPKKGFVHDKYIIWFYPCTDVY